LGKRVDLTIGITECSSREREDLQNVFDSVLRKELRELEATPLRIGKHTYRIVVRLPLADNKATQIITGIDNPHCYLGRVYLADFVLANRALLRDLSTIMDRVASRSPIPFSDRHTSMLYNHCSQLLAQSGDEGNSRVESAISVREEGSGPHEQPPHGAHTSSSPNSAESQTDAVKRYLLCTPSTVVGDTLHAMTSRMLVSYCSCSVPLMWTTLPDCYLRNLSACGQAFD